MRKLFEALLFLFMAGFLDSGFALEGESIVFNPATGNYLITYLNSTDDTFRQITFIPATKINPKFKIQLKQEQDRTIGYKYSLINDRESQQVIRMFILDPVSSVTTSLAAIPLSAPPGKIMEKMSDVAKYFDTPTPWDATMSYSYNQMSFRIGWSYDLETGGLSPGHKAVFGYKSNDLPGIINAEIFGDAPGSQNIPSGEVDDEDGAFGQQYTELVFKNNFVPKPTAVPAISVPNPFNASVLIDRIQTQMHTWIAMQLLDATFSSQLDRYLTAAANAYRLNQPKAGKEHIQTLRKTLKKEHEDSDRDDDKEDGKHEDKSDDKAKRMQIDRLAARVLDFNLKYVLKRMGDD